LARSNYDAATQASKAGDYVAVGLIFEKVPGQRTAWLFELSEETGQRDRIHLGWDNPASLELEVRHGIASGGYIVAVPGRGAPSAGNCAQGPD